MKIAQVAPLAERCPPRLYGGTERVVSYLTEELVAPGPRRDAVRQRRFARPPPGWCRVLRQALRLNPAVKDHAAPPSRDARRGAPARRRVRRHPFPHRSAAFPADPRLRRSHADDAARPARPAGPAAVLSRRSREMPLVSISDSQRRPMPAVNWVGTVHSRPAARPAAVLAASRQATISPSSAASRRRSGPTAPSRSRARAGLPLKIAAKVDNVDRAYWTTVIEPLVARHDRVEFIGEIDETREGGLPRQRARRCSSRSTGPSRSAW